MPSETVNIDWSGIAGKIRAQGKCGSCYALAAADAIGSINAIFKYGFHIQLSAKQIMDCNDNNMTFGCNGGFL